MGPGTGKLRYFDGGGADFVAQRSEDALGKLLVDNAHRRYGGLQLHAALRQFGSIASTVERAAQHSGDRDREE
jgi:hypothetical protein